MFSSLIEPEHRTQLRASVAGLLGALGRPQRRSVHESEFGFDADLWDEFAELGWLALMIPEDHGGLGLAFGDLQALHHEIGRGARSEPLAIVPLLAGRALSLGDNALLRERVLGAIIAGERLPPLAWQGAPGEPGSGNVGPRAMRKHDGWALTGDAHFVPLTGDMSGMVVAAAADEGIVLLWVETGFVVSDRARRTDGTSHASIAFDCCVPDDHTIAGSGTGGRILDHVLNGCLIAVSAELLGLAEQMFLLTLLHLKQRRQFGRVLASFQALQHRMVNLYIHIELARSALQKAATACDSGNDDAPAEVSAAKSRCGDAARLVAKESIQLHGAIGYTDEYELGRFVKRTLALSSTLGTGAVHRARYGRLKYLGGDTGR